MLLEYSSTQMQSNMVHLALEMYACFRCTVCLILHRSSYFFVCSFVKFIINHCIPGNQEGWWCEI